MKFVNRIIKRILYYTLPNAYNKYVFQIEFSKHNYLKYLNKSFSQEGEDMILSQIFYGNEKGFFVDIGAHHPKKYSNTYKFYLLGWRGINIDAMPNSMQEFKKERNQDINLEFGISSSNTISKYFIFEQGGLNTFSENQANKAINDGYSMLKTIDIQTYRLDNIFEKYLPKNQKIDFMSVDVEGLEFEVLDSNNWNKFRPSIIIIESLKLSTKNKLDNFLNIKGYRCIAYTINNIFYQDVSKL